MRIFLFLFLFFRFYSANAQLKYIVEDFEGLADGSGDLKTNGLFTFGNAQAGIEQKIAAHESYSGDRYIQLEREGKKDFGGWGKGIGFNIELSVESDYLNFYLQQPASNGNNTLKIELQEDDNDNNVYDKEGDDSWIYTRKFYPKSETGWELVSIPLSSFSDANAGGDGVFNISYKKGKLFCFIVSFLHPDSIQKGQRWNFDMICFSKGKLPTGTSLFTPPVLSTNDYCSLGAWSKEGNTANFTDIASGFEQNFKPGSDKKLGVVHFFQPFAVDGGNTQNHYPSVERINKVIHDGYVPMITLEDHFVKTSPGMKQPNLYSIVEGHFDSFFAAWAKQIKQVEGTVLLRILHEFNGDWYPWCTVNNDKDPQMLIKAYRHIHDIFNAQQVTNVKFIWCPNSTSFPQESWNYILEAYPGDDYVDYVALDIYNGAGTGLPVWRSFRKEGMENYFLLTEKMPQKPLFVCEVSSRERKDFEPGSAQNKAEWIRQMSEALSTDMTKVRLLTWFNEKGTFRIDSSPEARQAFLTYVMKKDHFKSGKTSLDDLLHP